MLSGCRAASVIPFMRLVTLARSLVKEKPGHAYMLLTAVVLVSFGVVGFRIGSSTPSYKVATWSPPAGAGALPEGRALTGVTGLLAGRINADGTACFWLSNEGYQPALMWPPRYSAHGNPLTVYSKNGQPVATVGEFVNLDGAVTAPEDILKEPVLGCPRMSSLILVAP